MKQRRNIVFFILCAIPVAAILFLLAIANVVYFLLGLIVVLGGLVALKRWKPELFPGKRVEGKRGGKTPPPPPPPEKVYMVLSEREAHGAQRIMLNKTVYSIGRGRGNDFVVESPRIGRRHLRVEYSVSDNICYAIDLGSVNGTFLNSERMEKGRRYPLHQDDRLMIDDHAFVVDYGHY